MRIHRAGLAAVAGREHPDLRGQLRRRIDHALAVRHQPMRDVLTDAVATLHDRHHPTSLIDDLDRRRSLVRTHPDDHTHAAPSRLELIRPEQARHRHVEQHKPLPSLSPRGIRPGRRP
jgi:hypothetical protein